MYNILLVEDEREAAISIVRLLENHNYKVKTTDKAVEALSFLNEEEFDLVIVDLILPDMNGTELCALIRHDKRIQNIPIVISTGVGDAYTQQENQGLGINGFLKKPYTIDELLLTIKNVLYNHNSEQ
ncbi:MAG: response regulator [Candidatus Omnitrophota bacterium]|nr:response regulator [Candidatus Omnitrophota bacterium]